MQGPKKMAILLQKRGRFGGKSDCWHRHVHPKRQKMWFSTFQSLHCSILGLAVGWPFWLRMLLKGSPQQGGKKNPVSCGSPCSTELTGMKQNKKKQKCLGRAQGKCPCQSSRWVSLSPPGLSRNVVQNGASWVSGFGGLPQNYGQRIATPPNSTLGGPASTLSPRLATPPPVLQRIQKNVPAHSNTKPTGKMGGGIPSVSAKKKNRSTSANKKGKGIWHRWTISAKTSKVCFLTLFSVCDHLRVLVWLSAGPLPGGRPSRGGP